MSTVAHYPVRVDGPGATAPAFLVSDRARILESTRALVTSCARP